jgi:hypothetical protein
MFSRRGFIRSIDRPKYIAAWTTLSKCGKIGIPGNLLPGIRLRVRMKMSHNAGFQKQRILIMQK